MGLREIAESDMTTILSDSVTGFSQSITVTDPAGTQKDLSGFDGDISQAIDPETGQAVSGRFAHVALSLSALTAVGFGIPQAIEAESLKPWLMQFEDLQGNVFVFKVSSSNPDRTLGIVTCTLEIYE